MAPHTPPTRGSVPGDPDAPRFFPTLARDPRRSAILRHAPGPYAISVTIASSASAVASSARGSSVSALSRLV
jgi:hypothetical protein